MSISVEEQKRQAIALALSFAQTEPQLKSVYLFRDSTGKSIRIIDVVENYFTSDATTEVDIFSFNHSVGEENMKLLVGTIPPSFVNENILPKDWGGWENSELVYEA